MHVRILMGSTFKMGAGTNVQDLIIASHDLTAHGVRGIWNKEQDEPSGRETKIRR